METIILLYYRMPYEDAPDLICACDSQAAVNKKIYSLRAQYPDAYPDINRFETSRVEFLKGEQRTVQKQATWKLNCDGSGTCSNCHKTQYAVWDQDNFQYFCGACGAAMSLPESPKGD